MLSAGLKSVVSDALLEPMTKEVTIFQDYSKEQFRSIKADTDHLRTNGVEVRVRLNNTDLEIEGVRQDAREQGVRIKTLEARPSIEIKTSGVNVQAEQMDINRTTDKPPIP